MTKANTLWQGLRKLMLAAAILPIFMQCTEEEYLPVHREQINTDSLVVTDTTSQSLAADCAQCDYVVPAGVKVVDVEALGLKPGSVIGLSGKIEYGTLEFHNMVGTPEQPFIIRNCDGTARIVATDKWHALRTEYSKYYRITGGDTPGVYGIKVTGGEMGLKLDQLSTNFEVDHVEVSNVGFAGIMAKTDPSCDDRTIRGNFTMYDVKLHDNYVHDTGGEGFYVGNSFWDGMDRGECGIRLPHEIKGLKIFNNILTNTGWEALQVGCGIEGTEIYNNTIKNYGQANQRHQNNGMQIGAGTGGLVYNNFIKHGPGNGLIMMGTGDNVIYNNIIVDAGENGIFADERYTPGEGFKFINNTILSPKLDGIRLYADKVPMNAVLNNIIANPGSYGSYSGKRTNADAFVYLLNSDVKVNMNNNLFVKSEDEINFIDATNENYRLAAGSPAINFGLDISKFRIEEDFYKSNRLRGNAYDAGASEF